MGPLSAKFSQKLSGVTAWRRGLFVLRPMDLKLGGSTVGQVPLPIMLASMMVPLVVMALWPRSKATEGPGFAIMLAVVALVVGLFAWLQYGKPYFDRSIDLKPTSTLHVLTSIAREICFEVYEDLDAGGLRFTVAEQSYETWSPGSCEPRFDNETSGPDRREFQVLVVGTGDIVDALRKEPEKYPGWVLAPQVMTTWAEYDMQTTATDNVVDDGTNIRANSSSEDVAVGVIDLCGCDKDLEGNLYSIPSTTGTRSSASDRVVVQGPTIHGWLGMEFADVELLPQNADATAGNIALPKEWDVTGTWWQDGESSYSFSVGVSDWLSNLLPYKHGTGEYFSDASAVTSWDPLRGVWQVSGISNFENSAATYGLIQPQVSIRSESENAARERGLFIIGILFGVSGSFLAKSLEVWLLYLYKFDTAGAIRRRVNIRRSGQE